MSTRIQYDEDVIAGRLSRLENWERAAFALACAQRLLPLYLKYCDVTHEGDPRFARQSAEDLWQSLISSGLPNDALEKIAARSEQLVPDGQAVDVVIWHWYAMNAMAALAYAAQSQLNDGTEAAVWAARQAHEAVTFYVRRRDRMNLDSEREILRLDNDPVVQEELERQDRDLRLLEGDPPRDAKLTDLRQSAERARLFDFDSVM